MAKKITRATLNELAKEMALLSEQEQKAYLGGGSGTEMDPYTYIEYSRLADNGLWTGGHVEGLGYISTVEVIVYAQRPYPSILSIFDKISSGGGILSDIIDPYASYAGKTVTILNSQGGIYSKISFPDLPRGLKFLTPFTYTLEFASLAATGLVYYIEGRELNDLLPAIGSSLGGIAGSYLGAVIFAKGGFYVAGHFGAIAGGAIGGVNGGILGSKIGEDIGHALAY